MKNKSRVLSALTLAIAFFSIVGLISPVLAACTPSCTPSFYSDPELTTPLSSLQALSTSAFNTGDIYVAYQVCDTSTDVRINYCYTSPDHSWSTNQPSWCPTSPATAAFQTADSVQIRDIEGESAIAVGRILAGNYHPWAEYNLSGMQFIMRANGSSCPNRTVLPVSSIAESCNLSAIAHDNNTEWNVYATITNNLVPGKEYYLKVQRNGVNFHNAPFTPDSTGGILQPGLGIPKAEYRAGTYDVCVTDSLHALPPCTNAICSTSITVGVNTEPPDEEPWPEPDYTPPPALDRYKICNQLSERNTEGNPRAKCAECYDNEGIWTAVGCIKTDATTMVTQILRIAMGIAGGIALIMILAAGFMLSVSQGDPKRVSEARELITSAIIGLLFIIFSVTILQFIGVTLFRIPGFGGP